MEAIHFGCTLYYYGLLKSGSSFSFEKILSQFIRQFGPADPPKFSLYYLLLHDTTLLKECMVKFICDTRQLELLGISSDGKEIVSRF